MGVVPQRMIIDDFLLKSPLTGSTAFTGKGYAIGAPVARFTMPFPPIPAGTAFLTMPGAAVLDNLIPAKRVPIYLAAF